MKGPLLARPATVPGAAGPLTVDPLSGAVRAEKNLRVLPLGIGEQILFTLPFAGALDVYAVLRPQRDEPLPGNGAVVRAYAINDQNRTLAGQGRVRLDANLVPRSVRGVRCCMGRNQGAQFWQVTIQPDDTTELLRPGDSLGMQAVVYPDCGLSSGKFQLQSTTIAGTFEASGVVERIIVNGIGSTVAIEDNPPITTVRDTTTITPRYGSLIAPNIQFGGAFVSAFIESTT